MIEPQNNLKAVILIAGNGDRFKSKIPKQFLKMFGKKVYIHTLDVFLSLKIFDEIIIVCNKQWASLVKREVGSNVNVVEGGATRQESSLKGLLACTKKTDYVLIHDGVRPFVDKKIILENIKQVKTYNAVNTCIPITDTIIHSKDGKIIEGVPKRSEFLRGQTPQTFKYDLILNAHEKAIEKCISNATDDCSLISLMGKTTYLIKGSENNIKITTKLDMYVGKKILQNT